MASGKEVLYLLKNKEQQDLCGFSVAESNEIVEKKAVKGYLEKISEKTKETKIFLKNNQEQEQEQEQNLARLGQFKLNVLKGLHVEFDEYLKKRFGKSFDTYKKYFLKLKEDNVFDCIAVVEGVSKDSLWEVFEKIVDRKKEVCREFGVKDFLYLSEKDRITEDFINKLKQKGYIVHQDVYVPLSVLNSLKEGSISAKDIREYAKLVLVFTRKLRSETSLERDSSKGQKIFEQIFKQAIYKEVSDVHVLPGTSCYHVYFRKDGFFEYQKDLTLSLEEAENFIVYLMRRAAEEVGGHFNPDTRLAYQDARISVTEAKVLWGKEVDLRLAFIPDGTPKSKLEVGIRILCKQERKTNELIHKKDDLVERLKELGYLEEDVKILKNVLYKRNGIVLVSGITNSGKSTLVSNLLASIKDKKIGTIEDPIEYFIDLPNYVQHQLFISDQEKISMDFVDYVKAFKRADYDIVFVGEWRNHKGLTRALLEQAYAGQLIFTTLHVGSSFQVLKGLESVFGVNIEELKPVLLLCWNQVLVPRLCLNCRKKVKIVSVRADVLEVCKSFPGVAEEMINQLESFALRDGYEKGEGCSKCEGRGYSGRQVVYDYFLPTVDFWERLGKDYSHYNVMKSARIKKTKIDVFLQLVTLGVVDVNDVYLVL